jgi:hypothetical protein
MHLNPDKSKAHIKKRNIINRDFLGLQFDFNLDPLFRNGVDIFLNASPSRLESVKRAIMLQ